MASSAPVPDEAKEINLIDKVELRIASASTNAKLSDLLKVYLAPLLLKLASPHAKVRAKIVKLCQHISLRAEAPDVELPVEALLRQYKEHLDSSLVKYHALLYAQKGLRRLSASARSNLLPVLTSDVVKTLANIKDIQTAKYFHILLQVLADYPVPQKGTEQDISLKNTLALSTGDVDCLSKWLSRLVLFRPVLTPNPSTIPGLRQDEIDFFTIQNAPEAWRPGTDLGLGIIDVKRKALSFLVSSVFEDHHRLLAALYAAGDPNPAILERGDEMLKKISASDVFTQHPKLMADLYQSYLGEEGLGAGLSTASLPSLKVKILGILSRSDQSAQFPEYFARILDDTLRNPDVMDIDEPAARPKKGLESAKLRAAVFTFANHFLRYVEPSNLEPISNQVMATLRDFVTSQGWPTPMTGEDLGLRQSAYETLGAIAKAINRQDLDLLTWFFESLSKDGSSREVTMAIEHGLSSLIAVFAKTVHTDAQQRDLAELLIERSRIESTGASRSDKRARFAAVRFANRCLPFNNVKARKINVIALAEAEDSDREIIEESRKGLDPWWFKLLNSESPHLWQLTDASDKADTIAFPDLHLLCMDLFDIKRSLIAIDDSTNQQRNEILQARLERSPRTVLFAMYFARQVFAQTALQAVDSAPTLSPDWKRKVLVAAFEDDLGRSSIKSSMTSAEDKDLVAVDLITQAALLSWKQISATPGLECETAFVDIISCAPMKFLETFKYVQKRGEVVRGRASNNPIIRTAAARSFGILFAIAYAGKNSEARSIVARNEAADLDSLKDTSPWREVPTAQLCNRAGLIESSGFAVPRLCRLYPRPSNKDTQTGSFGDEEEMLNSLWHEAVEIVLEASDSDLLNAAFTSIGQLGIFNCLPSTGSALDAKAVDSLLDKLAFYALKGKEKAVIALGRISLCLGEGEAGNERVEKIGKLLRSCHEVRQLEVQFAVGEALAILAGGWRCSTLNREHDIDGLTYTTQPRPEILGNTLDQTIADCKASKPALRKAAVIWLLSLVQFCGESEEVQNSLRRCQAAFKSCLSDRDELVQEAASRGLGLVYEKGDRDLKDTLVRDLVGSFTGDKAQMGEVTEDTQLFEEGALPTGDGSITSYKDILSLAAEVGNPSLVYRFMSLAANNAIWSSRAAFGRFGLSNVFSDSAVDGYLAENPKLYPKLYRYQFDPNTNVQRSMKDIWSALVKDTNKTLEQHFNAIMDDLLKSIISKEWRVRQASCAAVGDLIQGRKLEVYESYLAEIWKTCFMVLDDIKGSVQQAAHGLARILSNILLRSLEAGDGSARSSSKMLENVLPFLRSNAGLGSKAENVQLTALKTLIEIINKGSAKVLRPFIPELIELLIGQLAEMEGQGIEYLRMKASEYKITAEQIDDFRTRALKGNPAMVAIDRCLGLVDEESMAKVVATLENAAKSSIALPSKIGCSTIIVTLATRHRLLFQPHADRFLTIMEKAVQDRNDTVSNAYANAAGYLARIASDQQILRWSAFAQKLYQTNEDDRHRIIAADCIAAVAKHATDRFTNLASDFVPFIFIAKHDDNEHVKKTMTDTWDDSVGGSRSVMLYLKEIMATSTGMLDSPKWSLKHTAARAIAGAVDALAASVGADGIPKSHAEAIWPALEKALAGKTWDGKEVVVTAFAKFVQKTALFWTEKKNVATQITKIILREARRNNHIYQQHALPALASIATARTDIDMTTEVFDTVTPLIETLTASVSDSKDADAMDIDGGEGLKNEDLKTTLLIGTLKATSSSLHTKFITGPKISTFLRLAAQANTVTNPKLAAEVFAACKKVFESITQAVEFPSRKDEVQTGEDVETLLFQQVYAGYAEAVRKGRAEAVLAFVNCRLEVVSGGFKGKLVGEIEAERSVDVRKMLEDARGRLDVA